jgi:hypothetical protein
MGGLGVISAGRFGSVAALSGITCDGVTAGSVSVTNGICAIAAGATIAVRKTEHSRWIVRFISISYTAPQAFYQITTAPNTQAPCRNFSQL